MLKPKPKENAPKLGVGWNAVLGWGRGKEEEAEALAKTGNWPGEGKKLKP